MAWSRFSALLLLGAIALASRDAAADEDSRSSEIDQARALAQESGDLIEAGRYEEALERAQQAEELYHAPIHLLMIAEAQEALGRLAQAAETYERLVAEPLSASTSPVFRQAQETGAKNLKHLLAMLPSVLIVVDGPSLSATRATVDGKAIKLTGRAIRLDPGPHSVRVEADGYAPYEDTITLPHKGGVIKVDVFLLEPTEGMPRPPPPVEAPPTDGGSYVPAVIAFGVGGAGLVLGGITGAMFLSRMSDLNDRCPDDRCVPEDQPEIDSAGVLGNVSTVGFGVGIVGVAVGVVLLATRESGDVTASVGNASIGPWLGSNSMGIAGRF